MLHEERRLWNWEDIKGLIPDDRTALYTMPPQNRFLQIVVSLTPHANFTRHRCGVTKRWNVRYADTPPHANGRPERVGKIIEEPTDERDWPIFEFAGNSFAYSPHPDDPHAGAPANFLERACSDANFMIGVIESAADEIRQCIEEHEVEAASAIAAVAVVGGAAGLAATAAALAVILAIVAAIAAALSAASGNRRFGEVMNDVQGQLLDRQNPVERAAGSFAWQLIAYKAFEYAQKPLDYDAISYAIMDRHDYLNVSCDVNVDSIEVFFEADDPHLVAFIDALLAFEMAQEFNGKASVGYISLRFTGKSTALLAPARWRRTCVVEVAGLKDVDGVSPLIDFAILLSRHPNIKGILHWGQRNESNQADIELRFGGSGGDLERWREVLARLTDEGRLDGFSNAFTRQTGLEVQRVACRWITRRSPARGGSRSSPASHGLKSESSSRDRTTPTGSTPPSSASRSTP